MNKKTKKVTVLIPCRNEADGIADVIKSFPRNALSRNGFSLDIIVIDNNSTDKTAQIARMNGAVVVEESLPGKGNAMKQGFASVSKDTDYVVMIDGDDTYQASELYRLIEPLDAGFCSVVIGSRLAGKISNNAMSLFNRLGNWGFSFLVRYVYRANVTDVLTGYFAWRREALDRLRPHLTARGFGIEMDMVTKMAKLGEEIYCVPITYAPRSGSSNLSPIIDGFRILGVFLKNLIWRPGRTPFRIPIPRIRRSRAQQS